MASKANYFKIGLFVIGTVTIIVAFTIALGLGSWGKKQIRFETYIDESVQGLNIGSPVKNRGVQIGSVEDITFVTSEYDLDQQFLNYSRYVMVVIAVDSEKFVSNGYDKNNDMLDQLIQKGLRVRLTTQALTGISYLEVDYFAPNEYPPLEFPWDPKYKYLPSAQSVFNTFTQSIDQTLKKLENIDLEKISENFNSLIVTADKTLKDLNAGNLSTNLLLLIEELRDTNTDLKDVIYKTDSALSNFDIELLSQKIGNLLDNVDSTTTNANSMISDIKDTNQLVQEILKPASEDQTTIPELTKSVNQLINDIDNMIQGNQSNIEDIIRKLDDISSNLMIFSQDIKNDPGILLFTERPEPSEVVK